MHDNEIDKLFAFMKTEFKAGTIKVNFHDYNGDHDAEMYQIDEYGFDKLREYLRKV